MATPKKNTAGTTAGPGPNSGLALDFTKEQDIAVYRDMLVIRRFEEKAGQMYGMGLIGGFCHLYIGQEAVVVGMQMALRDGYQVITGCRILDQSCAAHKPFANRGDHVFVERTFVTLSQDGRRGPKMQFINLLFQSRNSGPEHLLVFLIATGILVPAMRWLKSAGAPQRRWA